MLWLGILRSRLTRLLDQHLLLLLILRLLLGRLLILRLLKALLLLLLLHVDILNVALWIDLLLLLNVMRLWVRVHGVSLGMLLNLQ